MTHRSTPAQPATIAYRGECGFGSRILRRRGTALVAAAVAVCAVLSPLWYGGGLEATVAAQPSEQEAWVLDSRWPGLDGRAPAGYVREPAGIAVDEDGDVYVTDAYRGQVHVFRGDAWVRTWGGQDAARDLLTEPRGIAAFGGRVYVADAAQGRIKVFTAAGDLEAEWPGVGRPWGVAAYGPDRLLVSDTSGDRLLVLDLQGRIRTELGRTGEQPGQLRGPRGVAAWPDRWIAVFDAGNNRVQVWEPDGTPHQLFENSSPLPFRDVGVFGSDGLLVASLRFLMVYQRDSPATLTSSRAPVPGGFTAVGATQAGGGMFGPPFWSTFEHDYIVGLRRLDDERFQTSEDFRSLPGPAGEFVGPRRIVNADDGFDVVDAWPRVQRLSTDGGAIGQAEIAPVVAEVAPAGAGTRFVSNGSYLRRLAGELAEWQWSTPVTSTWLVGLALDRSADELVTLNIHEQSLVRVATSGQSSVTFTLGNPGFQNYTDLDLAPDGRLLLVNRGRSAVEVRSGAGALMDFWPVRGVPLRVAWDAAGGAFVLTREGWIWHLDPAGAPLGWWDAAADATGRRGLPSDLAVGADGRVVVTDERADEVRVYALDPDAVGDPAPGGDGCTFVRDKWAAPGRILLGASVDVTLTVSGDCLEAGLGADVMLVIDRSGSMAGTKMQAARSAAVSFVGEMDFSQSRVGVVAFNTEAAQPLGLSASPADVIEAVVGFGPATGGTDIGEGIQLAAAELQANGRAGVEHVIVVMTDGRPEGEVIDTDAAADAAKMAGVRLFAIGFGVDVDPELMRRVASRPQDYFFAPGAAELSAIYTEIARRISGGVVMRTAVITDVVPINMVLDSASVRPAPATVEGREIRWEFADVRNDLELTYKVTPLELGVWPTNDEAWLDYLDGLDVRGRLPFPVPLVEVVAPTIIYLPFAAKAYCRPTNLRADVALVIDASSSMDGEKLAAAKRAAEAFVDRLALPADQAAVITFDAEPHVLQGLTGDRFALRDAIARIDWHPGTAIHTAIDAATNELTGSGHREDSNRVMVLLTDGQNNDGAPPVRSAGGRARAAGVIVYTVALGDDADRELMVEVAGAPSRAYVALGAADLERIYGDIAGTIPCAVR